MAETIVQNPVALTAPLAGCVSSVDTGAGTITLLDSTVIQCGDSTAFTVDGNAATLADVVRFQRVSATLAGGTAAFVAAQTDTLTLSAGPVGSQLCATINGRQHVAATCDGVSTLSLATDCAGLVFQDQGNFQNGNSLLATTNIVTPDQLTLASENLAGDAAEHNWGDNSFNSALVDQVINVFLNAGASLAITLGGEPPSTNTLIALAAGTGASEPTTDDATNYPLPPANTWYLVRVVSNSGIPSNPLWTPDGFDSSWDPAGQSGQPWSATFDGNGNLALTFYGDAGTTWVSDGNGNLIPNSDSSFAAHFGGLYTPSGVPSSQWTNWTGRIATLGCVARGDSVQTN